MADHYTATVEITRTTSTPPPAPVAYADRRHQSTTATVKTEGERSVDQLARIVIRESNLDALRDKVAAHVALIGGGL